MSPSASLRVEVEEELAAIATGEGTAGGSRRGARRVDLNGISIFLKYDLSAPTGFFAAEAAGLEAIRRAVPEVRVPRVYALGEGAGGRDWIALEWLDGAGPPAFRGAELGVAVAKLHRTTSGRWGWDRAGFIGNLTQSNRESDDWPTFWWRERLEPQLDLALASGHGVHGPWRELRRALPARLSIAAEEGPSLLHGDLWSGNAVSLPDGVGLIDPSCYFGHREVDLAMAELFGGFGSAFRMAYERVWPLSQGYPGRIAIYQLYYLLVHVNLFGESYVDRTMATLRTALEA